MEYQEENNTGDPFRKDYLCSLETMIKALQEDADKARRSYFEKLKHNPEEYRAQLKRMLGWPLCQPAQAAPPQAKVVPCFENAQMRISRIQLHLETGLQFYGIFFEHADAQVLPLVIAQHGLLGTPELCSGLLEAGTYNYNDMVMRVFHKGVNVFVPQLFLWNDAIYEPSFGDATIEQKRESIDAQLKQLGSSITAVEVHAIMQSIDYLVTLKNVDREKLGMIGLSYGGFYTLFTAACDTRIKAALSCCQYNDRYAYARVDWTWFNSAYTFLDNEVASLVYPRHLLLAVGNNDPAFSCALAQKEYRQLKELYDDSDWLDFYCFDGEHEFIKEDKYLDKFISLLNA